jgi:peptide deformylase
MTQIFTTPNPILRKKSQKIKAILNSEIQNLIPKMIDTMRKNKGIGIAAPQIGKSYRLIIVETKDGSKIFANPKILWHSKKEEIGEEGCLSVPETYGLVKRWCEIKLEAQNEKNEKIVFKAQGLFAKVLQHEIDHLDGILFIDRLIKQTSGAKINLEKEKFKK